MYEIERFSPRQARHELRHQRHQGQVHNERLAAVADVASTAFAEMVRVRGVAAQAVALDPDGAFLYAMFAATAGFAMNSVISSAGRCAI